MKAGLYVRVSTEDQRAGASIDGQLYELMAWAKELDLEVSKKYIDAGRSGSTMDRGDLIQMLADAKAGEIDVLLVYHNDRLSRNVEDVRRIMRELKAGLVEVRFKNISETTTPEGKLQLNVQAAVSEYYIDDLKRKTRMGMAERKRSGTWTGRLSDWFELKDPSRGNLWHNIVAKEGRLLDIQTLVTLRGQGKSYRFIGYAYGLDHHKVKRILILWAWLNGQYAARKLEYPNLEI